MSRLVKVLGFVNPDGSLEPIDLELQRFPTSAVRRAVWWARTWACAYSFKRSARPGSLHRQRSQRVYVRGDHVRMTELQAWRVHKHEKQAWARLEELAS